MYALLKVIPLFCTTHPLLRITLRHPRWRGFFPLARKEQTMVSFAELKLLFAIIMPQIGWQLPGLLSKNKNMKEMWVIQKSAEWFFTSRPSSCGIIQMSWLRLWIMRAVNPVGQLHGSPTALTRQYLAWDRHCIHMLFKLREWRDEYFWNKLRPTETAISAKVSWPLITTPQTKFEWRFIVTDVLGTWNKMPGTRSVHTNGVCWNQNSKRAKSYKLRLR